MSELKLYCLVRTDIEIPIGKLCAQTGHAFLNALWNAGSEIQAEYLGVVPHTHRNLTTGQVKIVLKAKNLAALERAEQECAALGISTALITDEGRTVFETATTTCLGVGPCRFEDLPKYVQKMQLF